MNELIEQLDTMENAYRWVLREFVLAEMDFWNSTGAPRALAVQRMKELLGRLQSIKREFARLEEKL